ncbi:potassium voltage-gated channel protein Shaw-like [Lineus longissimus]|uniref:potassium voltage-gated channel protein Shaw-like n=1 Tax=Lineus longissimus TaxID=88925 RepID=UPI00315DA1AC
MSRRIQDSDSSAVELVDLDVLNLEDIHVIPAPEPVEVIMNSDIVIFDVSGTIFRVRRSTINTVPKSRLGAICASDDYPDKLNGTYYLDRDPDLFAAILNACRNPDEIHVPDDVCPEAFREELVYWGLDPTNFSTCCIAKVLDRFSEKKALSALRNEMMSDPMFKYKMKKHPPFSSKFQACRYRAWLFLEYPIYSKPAMAWGIFFYIALVTSIILTEIATLPASRSRVSPTNSPRTHNTQDLQGMLDKAMNNALKAHYENYDYDDYDDYDGSGDGLYTTAATLEAQVADVTSSLQSLSKWMNGKKSVRSVDGSGLLATPPTTQPDIKSNNSTTKATSRLNLYWSTSPVPWIMKGQIIFLVFFTLEVVVRFLLCSEKVRFFTCFYNILDILMSISATLSVIVENVCKDFNGNVTELCKYASYCTGVATVFRTIRIFKLSRCCAGLRVLILVVQSSFFELMTLILFLIVAMLIFSTLIYYAELHLGNGFISIPVAYYWSLITMTTVGYGDMHPNGTAGYIIGVMCSIVGILITGMAIPIIGNNFNKYYSIVCLIYGAIFSDKFDEDGNFTDEFHVGSHDTSTAQAHSGHRGHTKVHPMQRKCHWGKEECIRQKLY